MQVHEVAGVPAPELRPATLRAAISGWMNRDEEEGRKKRVRQAMTLTHMEMLKLLLKLNEQGWSIYKRRLIFTVATMAFWGALRMGEVLTKTPRKFDELNDLLMEDVRVRKAKVGSEEVTFLAVRLKSTKACRQLEKGLEIEIYQIGGALCPVKAWKRYRGMVPEDEGGYPAFRQESGLAYSHNMMNRDLKELFDGRVDYGAVSGHSFRIGIATLLAECGYTDEGKGAVVDMPGDRIISCTSYFRRSRDPGHRQVV